MSKLTDGEKKEGDNLNASTTCLAIWGIIGDWSSGTSSFSSVGCAGIDPGLQFDMANSSRTSILTF